MAKTKIRSTLIKAREYSLKLNDMQMIDLVKDIETAFNHLDENFVLRPRNKEFQNVCIICNKTYIAKSKKGKFCSNKCKQKDKYYKNTK